MKVLYVRVSSVFGQNTDRQKTNEKEFELVIEDKCSGSIPFFNREGGKKILTLIEKGMIESISCHSIDRCAPGTRQAAPLPRRHTHPHQHS